MHADDCMVVSVFSKKPKTLMEKIQYSIFSTKIYVNVSLDFKYDVQNFQKLTCLHIS